MNVLDPPHAGVSGASRMAVACATLPGFLVQVHVRRTPSLAGRPFAVVATEPGGASPRIVAMSRAARDAGITAGMTVTQARAVVASLTLVEDDPALAHATTCALAEALLALSVTVDIGTPGAVYLHVPPSSSSSSGAERARAFGARVIAVATRQGLAARVGVADDRFTALVSARAGRGGMSEITIVPPRGAAAFLAPLPLLHLPLDPDVRRTLGLLGVRTLGDFAGLPSPSVGRRWAAHGVDLQVLARGDDPTPLHGWMPIERVRELVELDGPVQTLEPLLFVLRPLLERAVLRLAGRGKAVARLTIGLEGPLGPGGPAPARVRPLTEVTVAPARPSDTVGLLFELARAALAERVSVQRPDQGLAHAVERLHVTVPTDGEGEPQGRTLELFGRHHGQGQGGRSAAETADTVDRVVARLSAAFGPGAAQGVELADAHRPEATFRLVPFVPPAARASRPNPKAARRERSARKPVRAQPRPVPAVPIWAARVTGNGAALRLLERPLLLTGTLAPGERLQALPDQRYSTVGATIGATGGSTGRAGGYTIHVASLAGPLRLDGEWWSAAAFDRDYVEVRATDGGRYWVYADRAAGGALYLHGVFD